jgi:hypothetical protein
MITAIATTSHGVMDWPVKEGGDEGGSLATMDGAVAKRSTAAVRDCFFKVVIDDSPKWLRMNPRSSRGKPTLRLDESCSLGNYSGPAA